jgi:synaptotagmin-14/16
VFFLKQTGSSRYPYNENSSSDSEEEILRRLKLQQSISLQSGQSLSSKYEKYGGINQSINLEGFQPILSVDVPPSTKIVRQNRYNSSSLNNSNSTNNSHQRYQQNRPSSKDLLGQAERGKIGNSHSSSECSSNSSVEASVESNMGLISHERKGECNGKMELKSQINQFYACRS